MPVEIRFPKSCTLYCHASSGLDGNTIVSWAGAWHVEGKVPEDVRDRLATKLWHYVMNMDRTLSDVLREAFPEAEIREVPRRRVHREERVVFYQRVELP